MQVCPELTEGRLYCKAPHPFGKVFGRQSFKPWEIKRTTQKRETEVSTFRMTWCFHTGVASPAFYMLMAKEMRQRL